MAWDPYKRRTEPDMRREMNNLLDGVFPEIAKAQPVVLRKMRRVDGSLVKCACVDPDTKEPDKDTFCPICHGEGYQWDEVLIEAYKVQIDQSALREQLTAPGLLNIPLMVFYTRSSVQVNKEDKLVEMELDEEGSLVKPYRRKTLYRIGSVVDYRSDGGRLEYWKLPCYAEERKFLNGPGG